MRVVFALFLLFSLSRAELHHFSLDSVAREEAVDFETGSRFHLGWASWDVVFDSVRTAEGVVADYLLSPLGLLWCACDANAHTVFDTGYATLQTISQLRSAETLDLGDTTRFKPLSTVPDGYFLLESPFPDAQSEVRFILKDEKGNYSLFQIRGYSEISTAICCKYVQCKYLVHIEWWYQTDGTPSFHEEVNIRQKQHRITPGVQYSARNVVFDIRGRQVPNSFSGSGIFIHTESSRSCRIRLPAMAGQ